jgi:uncharacterized membrane protein
MRKLIFILIVFIVVSCKSSKVVYKQQDVESQKIEFVLEGYTFDEVINYMDSCHNSVFLNLNIPKLNNETVAKSKYE